MNAQAYINPEISAFDSRLPAVKFPPSRSSRVGIDRVRIRLARPSDARGLLEMHARLSPESVYHRYLHAFRMNFQEAQKVLYLNAGGGAAFVAVVKNASLRSVERVVGIAHYSICKENPAIAEPALLVEDRYQGHGVGRALWQAMLDHARSQNIEMFKAIVDPGNLRIQSLVQSSGLPYQKKYIDGYREIDIVLNPKN